MSVIASTDIYNQNDDVLFDRKTLEKLKKIDIEELAYDEDPDEDQEGGPNNDIYTGGKPLQRDSELSDDDNESLDDDQKRLREMEDGINEYFRNQKEYMMDIDRQLQKKEKKRKALIEQQRLKKEDVSEEEDLNNDDIRDGETVKKPKVKFQDDNDDEEMESDEEDGGLFVNPLLMGKDKKKKAKKTGASAGDNEISDGGFSSADEEDEKKLQKEKNKKDKKDGKVIGKRKKRGEEEDDVGDFFANTEIEVVPQTKFKTKDEESEEGYSSMDSDDLAETRALAKVMLRKKNREAILEATYNRYATHEDKSTLPEWFVEDESRHFRANNMHLLTKEMIADEKKFLKDYNERPSKKVQEAKARKKKRLAKAMNKIKNKATVIAEQSEISEGSKMK